MCCGSVRRRPSRSTRVPYNSPYARAVPWYRIQVDVVIETEDDQSATNLVWEVLEREGIVWKGMKVTGTADGMLELLEPEDP
jgi:hypothetical protein